jgi:hypothetical protein
MLNEKLQFEAVERSDNRKMGSSWVRGVMAAAFLKHAL